MIASSRVVAVVALVALTPRPAAAESTFWEEMITPGISAYRSLVETGRERVRIGDHDGALVSLRQAAGMLPDQGEAHLWIGFCLSVLERHDEAVAAFDRALAIDSSIASEDTVAFRLTITLARIGRYEQAADLYARMLATGVEATVRPAVLLNMADMLVASSCDHLEEAIEVYQESVRDYPDRAGGHWGLAAALFRAGRVREAERELDTAARLDPRWRSITSADVFFVPGYEEHLYRALGWMQRANRAQARLEWEFYLDRGGDAGCWADLARATIEELASEPSRGRR